MAAVAGRTRCLTCGKERATLKCGGCLKDFCYNHSAEHRNELSKQLDDVETTRNILRQTLTEQTTDPQKHVLMQQIDQWERDSILKIRETAAEARKMLLGHTTEQIAQIETKLNILTNQLRESREENDFFETDLHQWKEELARMAEQLAKPIDVAIQQGSTPLINKIYIDVSSNKSASSYIAKLGPNAKWVQNGVTVAEDNGQGCEENQLSSPHSVYVYDDETIYTADYVNNRIVIWKNGAKNGQVIAGGSSPGDQLDRLNHPTDIIADKERNRLLICDLGNRRVVQCSCANDTCWETIISDIDCYGLALDDEGYIYVSDHAKNEVRRWRREDRSGEIVAGGNGKGTRLDQLNCPIYVFVDRDHSVYVSDLSNHRVMKWAKGAQEGIVVAGGLGQGDGPTQLSNPTAIFVDDSGTLFVADSGNNRVMRWPEGATQGSIVVGGHGAGRGSNQLEYPMGLSFDWIGNLYVSDTNNHRIQKFDIDSNSQ